MEGFISRLENLLNSKGISRSDLCKDLSIPPTTVQNYFKGSVPNAEIAYKIAKYFGVSVEFLLYGKEEFKVSENEKPYTLDSTEIEIIQGLRKLGKSEKLFILDVIKDFINRYKEE